MKLSCSFCGYEIVKLRAHNDMAIRISAWQKLFIMSRVKKHAVSEPGAHDVCTYIRFRIERPIKYITTWYQRDCSNIAAKQRESRVQIGRRKCAHRLSCKYLPPRSRKSGMVIRGKKERERDTRSQAFLIYPKCWRRFNSGWLADWLQARARVRAISISELYMRRVYEYLGARSRPEREREWEREKHRVHLFVYVIGSG